MNAIMGRGTVGLACALLGLLGLAGCGDASADSPADETPGELQSALTNSRFGAWTALPGPPAGKQFNAAVEATSSWQRSAFADVFTRVTPGEQIVVTSRNLNVAGNWPNWQFLPALPVGVASSPSATTLPSCKTMVAAIGTDSKIYVTSRANNCSNAVNGSSWSNWTAATAAGYEAAPAIASGSNYVLLVARTGGSLAWWYSIDNGASFTGGWLLPALPDGSATVSPDLSSENKGQGNNFYAAAKSSSGKSFVLVFSESDFNWQATWREAPGLYSAGPTYLKSQNTLFGKGQDSGVWQTTGISFLPTGWSGPQEIGNTVFAGTNPGAVDRSDGGGTKVDVFQRVDATNIWWSAYR